MDAQDKKMVSKREKIALGLAITGIVWYFAENFYFGWNAKPESALEGAADFMVWVFWVLAFFIKPTRIENTKIDKTTIINAPMVEILKPNEVIMKQKAH